MKRKQKAEMIGRAKTIGLFVGGGVGVVLVVMAIFAIVSAVNNKQQQDRLPHFYLVQETVAGECTKVGDDNYDIRFSGIAKNGGEMKGKAKVTAEVFLSSSQSLSFYYESGIVMGGGSFTYEIVGNVEQVPERYTITFTTIAYA